MTKVKYSLLAIFTIALIINAWIFFTSKSNDENPKVEEFEVADNQLYNQLPKDNDAEYSMPAYIPTHSQSRPKAKVDFKEGGDNDALYSLPVSVPAETTPQPVAAAPVAAPAKKAPKKVVFKPEQPVAIPVQQTQPIQAQQQPVQAQPVAPLQPRARQPETPVYVPQYQQQPQQYEQQQYQQPAQQPNQDHGRTADPNQEVYPYYYY